MALRVEMRALTAASLSDEVEEDVQELFEQFLRMVDEQQSAGRSGLLKYEADKGVMKLSGSITFEIALPVSGGGAAAMNVKLTSKLPARAPKGRTLMVDLQGDGLYLVPKEDPHQDPLPFASRKNEE